MKKLIQSFKPRTKEERIYYIATAVCLIHCTILLILNGLNIKCKPLAVTFAISVILMGIFGINVALHEHKFSSTQSRNNKTSEEK